MDEEIDFKSPKEKILELENGMKLLIMREHFHRMIDWNNLLRIELLHIHEMEDESEGDEDIALLEEISTLTDKIALSISRVFSIIRGKNSFTEGEILKRRTKLLPNSIFNNIQMDSETEKRALDLKNGNRYPGKLIGKKKSLKAISDAISEQISQGSNTHVEQKLEQIEDPKSNNIEN